MQAYRCMAFYITDYSVYTVSVFVSGQQTQYCSVQESGGFTGTVPVPVPYIEAFREPVLWGVGGDVHIEEITRN